MRRWIAIFLLTASAFAQTQGNLPDLADSNASQSIGVPGNTIPMPEPVNAGELIDVCVTYNYDAAGLGGPYAVTDTLGNTYTLTSLAITPTFGHNRGALYHAYTISGSTGSDTITAALPSVNYSMTAGRFTGLSGTLDGSIATGTQTAAGAQTVSTTNTTSANGSVLISCAAGDTYSGGSVGTGTGEYVANNSCSNGGCVDPVYQSMKHTGLAGSQTTTDNTYATAAFGSNATFVKQTLAFKPSSTIAIVDTALHDAANGVSYTEQLHAVGGTAAYTWACSGLPSNGLTLNTSTGVISGATPTTGAVALGCTVTDGTVTSPTVNLTLTIKPSFLVPSVQEQRQANDELFGGSDAITFSNSVICGQVIAIAFYGQDTHSINGWVNVTNGTYNRVTDTLGTVFHRVGPIAGSQNAPQVWWIGVATSSGPETVTVTPSTPSSGLYWSGAILNNVQGVVDRGSFSTAAFLATSVASSYTTVVPNTLVVAATNSTNNANGGRDSGFSYTGMPTTVTDYGITASAAAGSSLVASPSTLNVTGTFSALNSGGNLVTGMFGFRPAATYTGVCSVNLNAVNDKHRRRSW